MHLSQQLSGIVAIFYYSTKFFITAGVPEETAQYSTIGVGAIMVIMTLVSSMNGTVGSETAYLNYREF